jgi:hypothetical protein
MSTIIRAEKRKNFTTISNSTLRDERLSWKARGLLAYMLTNNNDWLFYIDELKNHARDGFKATKSAFNELGFAGYLSVRIKYDTDNKAFNGREIIVHEIPAEKNAIEFNQYRNQFKHKPMLPETE